MKMNIEKEYKILVTKAQFFTLLQQYPNATFHKQINTYYDTVDGRIRQHCGAMRIRQKQNTYLFTLKLPAQEGLREYEMPVAKNDITVFQLPQIKSLLTDLIHDQPLLEIAQATTYRAQIDLSHAQLCFDYNVYGETADYELEYEYTLPHDGLPVFQSILAPAQLSYHTNCPSKIERVYQALARQ